MYIYSFEKLEVWQLSRRLCADIYTLTRNFPKEEMYGLSSQIRRASVSIASNIAEGTSRSTDKDKAYFSTLAFSSLMEVLNQLIIATDLGYLENEKLLELRKFINELGNKLNALKKSQFS